MNTVNISVATPTDAADMLDIYTYYVENTAITFEYTPPTETEFRARITQTLTKYPWLKAQIDGKTVGYAYLGTFKDRDAYLYSAETSIYISPDARRSGVGRLLYSSLERVAKLQNILNLNACIGCPRLDDGRLTFDSMYFHERMGYALVGKFTYSGYKFDQWYDMIWMEKMLGEHTSHPEAFRPFPTLTSQELQVIGINRT